MRGFILDEKGYVKNVAPEWDESIETESVDENGKIVITTMKIPQPENTVYVEESVFDEIMDLLGGKAENRKLVKFKKGTTDYVTENDEYAAKFVEKQNKLSSLLS